VLLRCVDIEEANQLMAEVHAGECGAHMNGFVLSRNPVRMGYYWSTMEHDCIKFVRACQECQLYADKQKAPAVLRHSEKGELTIAPVKEVTEVARPSAVRPKW
jgi:hypothetical protein